MRWGIGYKLAVIGPMELLDMAGLDIYNAVGSYLNQDLSTSGEVSSTIRDLIDKGRLGMKTGGGIYDYTPEQIDELRAQARRQARRRPEGPGGLTMKVWLLDNGSIVIEHTQLMWNVPGPQVRIPVYSVLVEHDDGLFLVRHGHRPRPHEPRAAVRAAGADRGADDPGAARERAASRSAT